MKGFFVGLAAALLVALLVGGCGAGAGGNGDLAPEPPDDNGGNVQPPSDSEDPWQPPEDPTDPPDDPDDPEIPVPDSLIDVDRSRIWCLGTPASDGAVGTADGQDKIWIGVDLRNSSGESVLMGDVASYSCESSFEGDVALFWTAGPLGPDSPAELFWQVTSRTAGTAGYSVRVKDRNGQEVVLGPVAAEWKAP